MRRYVIRQILLTVVAVSFITVNTLCAEEPNPVSPTPVTGNVAPPQGYPVDFPYIPGGTVYYMPDQLKQTIKVDIILNYSESAAELFEKLSTAAKAAGWTVDSYTAEEVTDLEAPKWDTRYRFRMKLGTRVIGGSVFRPASENATHLMISDQASTESPAAIPKVDVSGKPDALAKDIKLIEAAENGNLADLEAALVDGADINAKDVGNGITALIWASQNGHTDVVKFLLDKGADVNVKNPDGVAALLIASQNSHADIVKLLLDKGADVNAVKLSNGATPLLMASQKGSAEIIKLLLEKGADVNTKDPNGVTALWMASQKGDVEIIKLLLDKGADVNAKNTTNGMTALLIASQQSKTDVIKFLLDKGADINARDNKNGGTALIWASVKGKADVVKLLIERGADVNAKDINGASVLKLARAHGGIGIVWLLENAGAKE